MAEQIESTTSTEKAKVETMDDIANLLAGEIEKEDKEDYEPEAEEQDLEEGSTQSEESTEEAEEGKESEDEEVTWSKVLGVEEDKIVIDDDGNFKGFKTKVDGEDATIPVKDLIAGWQNNKSNTIKSQQLAEQRKEFENVRNYAVEEYTKKLDDVGKLNEYLEKNLVKEYQGIDWERLRMENPGEYAATIQDFQLRQNEIQNIQKVIEDERKKEIEVLQKARQDSFQEYLKDEYQKVLKNNPTWTNKEVFTKTLGELQSFVESSYGFTEQDFKQIQDARIFEVLKDAKAYREGQKVAQKKLATPLPKFQKPGNGKQAPKMSKLEQLTKAAKAAPPGQKKRDLEASAIAQILLGG